MTPRQLTAWSELLERDIAHDRADFINSVAAAMSGDGKEIKKLLKKLRELV